MSLPTEKPTTPQAQPGSTPPAQIPANGKTADQTKPNLAPAIEFASRYLKGSAGKSAEVTKKPITSNDGDGDSTENQKPKPPKKVAPKREESKPAQPQFDEEKLGRAIGETIAKATHKEEAELEHKEQAPPTESRRVRILKEMEKQWPERYSGLSDRYKKNIGKLREYAAKWEKDNPGEKFDENDEKHSAFRESLEQEVAYDDDDYTEALTEIKLQERLEKQGKEKDPETERLSERLGEFEREKKLREETPKIIAAQQTAGITFWGKLGDDFKSVVNEKGEISRESLVALRERDEDEYFIVVSAAEEAEALAAETFKLDNGLVKYDKTNPAHQFLSTFAIQCEHDILAKPEEDRMDDRGRVFASKKDYVSMTPEQKKRHWTFSGEDINFLLAAKYAKTARQTIKDEREKFQRIAKRRGLLKDPEPPSKLENDFHPLARQLAEDEPVEKPESPSAQSVPRMAPIGNRESQSAKNPLESFAARAIRGR